MYENIRNGKLRIITKGYFSNKELTFSALLMKKFVKTNILLYFLQNMLL